MPVDPTLELEQTLWASCTTVIGMDEVGRGALAGPVSVGALALRGDCGSIPQGLRDSKAMTALRRSVVAPRVSEWGVSAVGHASNAEIDELGIQASLGLAGRRALIALHELGVDIAGAAVLLDGTYDWLRPALNRPLRTTLRAKADRDCGVVAGAACVAKVTRDAIMVDLHETYPHYFWRSNKGYGSAAHLSAIAEHGPSDMHRRTWLRGVGELAGAS